MSALKQLRGRLKSIKSTQKITKAMQMVAASKLKKVKPSLVAASNYYNASKALFLNILKDKSIEIDNVNPALKGFLQTNNASKDVLLIVFSSEKGLCGSFNSSIIRKVKEDILQLKQEEKKVSLIIVGKKGYELVKSQYASDIEYYNSEVKEFDDLTIFSVYKQLLKILSIKPIQKCYVYFNLFKNPLVQIVTKNQIFPLDESNDSEAILDHSLTNDNFDFEGKTLLTQAIKQYIQAQLKFAQVNTKAGEEGARMNAMDSAHRNAEEITNALTLRINRSRQEIITRELIEIISGAEALSN